MAAVFKTLSRLAVVLTSPLVKSYLLNYARPLIYTTALNNATIIAIGCSFDMLEDGSTTHVCIFINGGGDSLTKIIQLANKLKSLVRYTLDELHLRLQPFRAEIVHLPNDAFDLVPSSTARSIREHTELLSPIIPVMTREPRPLAQHLRALGIDAKPITWPTVPKGKDRIRICLHAGNTHNEVVRLVEGIVEWAQSQSTALPRENCCKRPDVATVQSMSRL